MLSAPALPLVVAAGGGLGRRSADLCATVCRYAVRCKITRARYVSLPLACGRTPCRCIARRRRRRRRPTTDIDDDDDDRADGDDDDGGDCDADDGDADYDYDDDGSVVASRVALAMQ